MRDKEKGSKCVMVFHSIHYVIKAEKILVRDGYKVDIIPVPKEVDSDCGMAIEMRCRDMENIQKRVEAEGIDIKKNYMLKEGAYALQERNWKIKKNLPSKQRVQDELQK